MNDVTIDSMRHLENKRDWPEILTFSEVAAILRIGRGAAWRLFKSGAITSFRAGKPYRVRREALEDFIKGGRG